MMVSDGLIEEFFVRLLSLLEKNNATEEKQISAYIYDLSSKVMTQFLTDIRSDV